MLVVEWLANQISNPVIQDPFLGGENMNLHLTPDVIKRNNEARWVQEFLVWSWGWIESLWIFCEVLKKESVI